MTLDSLTVLPQEGSVSYERGTPVGFEPHPQTHILLQNLRRYRLANQGRFSGLGSRVSVFDFFSSIRTSELEMRVQGAFF